MEFFVKIKKNIFIFLFCGPCGCGALFATSLSLDVSAPIALLINAENGKVLFSKNAETPCHPASTTKIATALYALHRKKDSLHEKFVVSSEAVGVVSSPLRRNGKHPSYRLEFGGTLMGLKVGEEVSLASLLYGLMLPSGNDAANVIAEGISGSIPQFIAELNLFLKEIGCTGTQFTNPHGLTDLDHLTTAKDLVLMAREGMKYSFFREVVSSAKYVKPATNKQLETVLAQHNGLVKPGNKHFYPYATGVKTGYTAKAGHTLVASATKGDRSLIAMVAHPEGAVQRNRTIVQLFEAAFQEKKQMRKLFAQEYDLFQQKIEGGKEFLKAILKEDVIVSFYPSEETMFHPKLEWKSLSLPIRAGQEVGMMLIFDDQGSLTRKVPVIAIKDVEPTFAHQAKQHVELAARWMQTKKIYSAYFIALFLFITAFWKFKPKWFFRQKESDGA